MSNQMHVRRPRYAGAAIIGAVVLLACLLDPAAAQAERTTQAQKLCAPWETLVHGSCAPCTADRQSVVNGKDVCASSGGWDQINTYDEDEDQ